MLMVGRVVLSAPAVQAVPTYTTQFLLYQI